MKAATKCTLLVNATLRSKLVLQRKSDKALPAAADTKAASARICIFTTLPTVLIRVRYRGTAAAANIPTAFVRPGLTKGNTAAPNIIPLPVPRSARWPTPTTATSAATIPTLPWGMAV